MNIYNDENKGIYYIKAENGEPALVRSDGTLVINENGDSCFSELSKQAGEGWKRSCLLMKEYGIWDATAFGCTMMTGLGFRIKDKESEYALIFISCEAADKYFYRSLSADIVDQCRKNVEKFYKNPEMQKRWEGLILHPICLKFIKGETIFVPLNHEIIPVEMSDLDITEIRPVGGLSPIAMLNEALFDIPEMSEASEEDYGQAPSFIIKRKNYAAYAIEKNGSFIVLKGSTINPEITGVMPTRAMDARNEGMSMGYLSEEYEVLKNVSFTSSSSAAAFVVGHTVSGPKTWKAY